MIANLFLVCGWEYFIVNGSLPQAFASKIMGHKVFVAEENESRYSQSVTKSIDYAKDMESGEGVIDETDSDQNNSKN